MTNTDMQTSTAMDARRAASWNLPRDRGVAPIERLLRTHKRGYRAGSILTLEGGSSRVTYCVLSGWLSLSKSMENGQRQIIDFGLPGDFLNPVSANNETSTLQIEAVTYATVAAIPQPLWLGLLENYPQLRHLESRVIAGALSRLSERMLRLGKASAEIRIAHAMIELCIRLHPVGAVRDCSFRLPLTQQQLGEFVGLSSVHVCRTLSSLSRRGVILVQDQMNITIRDMDALADIAGTDPLTLESAIIPSL
jgi:CRP-like cAMP-binding protein